MDKLSKLRVLYVEDDDLIREELAETLEFDVKELITATNGEEGLEKFKKYNPDIVITDIKMPKMNGLDMSREIKKISPSTPIIVTTAFSDSSYLIKAIEIGINRYVLKPVDLDKLYEALEDLATILLYEKEKEIQERYIKYILDFSPSFILIAKKENIEYLNKPFLKFLNFSSIEELKKNVNKTEDLIEKITDINGNEYPKKNWIKNLLKDNKQYLIYFKKNPSTPFLVIHSKFEDLNKDILIFNDFSKLNEEILSLKKENKKNLELLKIESKKALLGEMINAIAHQWKQPLNVLSMITSFLLFEDEITKDKVKECVDTALKQIEYMNKTIEDFKEFLSPDKKIGAFSIKEVIDEALSLFKEQLKVHNIKVILEIDEKLKAIGYKNQFAQVLMNLIKNSKDAFDEIDIPNKYIKISTSADEDYEYIYLEDNAGGIKQEIINKIFEPYFTTKNTGTGIGLYISKMLIEDMKGKIYVESKENKTIFTISLIKAKNGLKN